MRSGTSGSGSSRLRLKRIEKVGRFLDPLVLIRQDDGYWTPNGNHRLQAMRKLGTKTIVGLLVADPDVAFKIVALNTEKAHNVKEKSLEMIRMARGSPAERLAARRITPSSSSRRHT